MSDNEDRPSRGFIVLGGARQNNLRSVNAVIPRRSFTVVTGVSGSGKSSLAIDTLYAEGQRRFLSGVSAHSRRFLERIPRPDLDTLDGISPAVALEQRGATRSARSTVGTSTEVVDYFRLLFARIGKVHCDTCREEVPRWTVERAAARWAATEAGFVAVTFPMVVPRSEARRLQAVLESRGYLRVMREGTVVGLDEAPGERRWDVLQDRVVPSNRSRFVEALEAAFRQGEGRAAVHEEGKPVVRLRLGRACGACDREYPEPAPAHFSFNSPAGACPSCQGFGHRLELDPAKIVRDPGKSLDGGAIEPWAGKWRRYFLKKLEASEVARRIPRDKPWRDLDPADRDLLLEGDGKFPGALPFLRRLSRKAYRSGARFLVKRYQTARLCPECRGARLGPEGRRVRVGNLELSAWCALPVATVRETLERLPLGAQERETVEGLRRDLLRRLEVLERVGLDYLSLDRLTRTLSGGESQRIELAQALGSCLVDALYVLDEPTVGLHPADTSRLLEVLRDLTRQGNTVVVVEHDRDVIAASDWMLDLGPGSGRDGGTMVYCGPTRERLSGPPSPTRDLLAMKPMPPPRGDSLHRGWIRLRDAVLHNLRGVDADIPKGSLAGVCGVSGSGKSTLVLDTLLPLFREAASQGGGVSGSLRVEREGLGRLEMDLPIGDVSFVDQSPPGRSGKSIPASYIGAWSGIRKLFADLPESRRLGFTAGTFSFNVLGGRCETCRGDGETVVDMDFMPDVRLPCEACEGARFGKEAMGPRFRGRNIVDVLGLTVDEAETLFRSSPSVSEPLRWMQRIGLGYLTLGQTSSSLSGGEAQRMKLVRELAEGVSGRLLVLDEPTVGLHGSEVRRLVDLLVQIVHSGNTVLVIEHHVDVLAACHWLVELGPGGGEKGGLVIAEGPPESVARSPRSRIAPFLATSLGRRYEGATPEDPVRAPSVEGPVP